MTTQERDDRLIELAMTLRVWPNDFSPHNSTVGLIQLCEECVKPEFEMVEVGCFAGVSTEVFALFAKKVWAVDAWKPCQGATEVDRDMIAWAQHTFERRMGRLTSLGLLGHVLTIKEESPGAAMRFAAGVLDMVYIDGNHAFDAIRADVKAWLPRLKHGGLLAGHDIDLALPALKSLGMEPQRAYPDSSWVFEV